MIKKCSKQIVIVIFVLIAMAACNNNGARSFEDCQARKKIILSEETDTSYIDNIESVSVINLEVDSDWVYFSYPFLIVNEWGTVYIDQDDYKMVTFDPDGKKISSKFIKGRGPGECINIGNIFQKGDSICIYDQATAKIIVYNFQGNFLGVLNKNTLVVADEVYPLSDGMFVGVSFYPSSTEPKTERKVDYVTLYDYRFEQLSKYLTLPSYYAYTSTQIGNKTSVLLYQDTLRFMLPYDHRFFSFTADSLECRYDFVSKHEIPSEVFNRNGFDLMSIEFHIDLAKNGWARMCGDLAETSRFISFQYTADNYDFRVLIDKTNDKEVSITAPATILFEKAPETLSTVQLWRHVIHSANILYSNEDYLYASVDCRLYRTLKMYQSSHDARLRDLYNQMKSYVEGKNLDETDRFLIRIKLIK